MSGAIGLLSPHLAALAAAGLSLIMVGAVYTLVSHHEYPQALTPLVVLVLLIGVGGARFSEAKRVIGVILIVGTLIWLPNPWENM